MSSMDMDRRTQGGWTGQAKRRIALVIVRLSLGHPLAASSQGSCPTHSSVFQGGQAAKFSMHSSGSHAAD